VVWRTIEPIRISRFMIRELAGDVGPSLEKLRYPLGPR